MNKLSILALLVAALGLAACAEQESYPVSGEECAPSDPVLDLDVPPCPPSPT